MRDGGDGDLALTPGLFDAWLAFGSPSRGILVIASPMILGLASLALLLRAARFSEKQAALAAVSLCVVRML